MNANEIAEDADRFDSSAVKLAGMIVSTAALCVGVLMAFIAVLSN